MRKTRFCLILFLTLFHGNIFAGNIFLDFPRVSPRISIEKSLTDSCNLNLVKTNRYKISKEKIPSFFQFHRDHVLYLNTLGVRIENLTLHETGIDGFYSSNILGVTSNWRFNSIREMSLISGDFNGLIDPLFLLVTVTNGNKTAIKSFGALYNYSLQKYADTTLFENLRLIHKSVLAQGYEIENAEIAYLTRIATSNYFYDFSLPWRKIEYFPKFKSVLSCHNIYVAEILKYSLPSISKKSKVLVMGSGSGIDAAVIATKKRVLIDAVDINPLAVANTHSMAITTHTDHLIHNWESDLFSNVPEKYDVIVFDAPLAVHDMTSTTNIELWDPQGKLLKRILSEVQDHLNPGGKLFLMSYANIKGYLPRQLQSRLLGEFEEVLGIHEITVKK